MAKGAKDFIDEVNKNPELRKKLYKQSAHIVLAMAKEHGYEFSQEELHDALREKLGAPMAPAAETGSDFCVVVIVVAAARNK
jgi:predicted ribosomally synthesized peptide with nif11-like leader